jgi:alkylation response protein AidB-like acyl-CoA dehydrogenase
MDINMTEEQRLLREVSRRFGAERYPMSSVRDVVDRRQPADEEYWPRAADLGWLTFLSPEERGGLLSAETGVVEAAIVAEERGRALQPGAYAGMSAAIHALASGDPAKVGQGVLDAAMAGEKIAIWVAGADGYGSGRPITAEKMPDGLRLRGSSAPVEGASNAAHLIVSAGVGESDGFALIPAEAAGVRITPLESLDLTAEFAEVTLDDVVVQQHKFIQSGGDSLRTGPGLAIDLLDLAALLTAFDSIGALSQLFESALKYAKDRVAFGRPIGSFQAVKHLIADMSLRLEWSRATAYAAARTLQERPGTVPASTLVSVAKVAVDEASFFVSQGCLQVYGGIGYTWEHPLHLYLRRVASNAAKYGDSRAHKERILSLNGI